MSISVCDVFWKNCLDRYVSGITVKCALYNSSAGLSYDTTTAYTSTNEITGTNYTAGGVTASIASGYPQLLLINDRYRACVRFDDVTFGSAASPMTVSGVKQLLFYDSTTSGTPAILIYTFPEEQETAAGTFVFSIPISQIPVINILGGVTSG